MNGENEDISIDLSELPTGLHMALRGKCFNLAQQLISDPRSDLNARDKRGSTPLHEAVRAGHCETIQLLLERGASVNARDLAGKTPLEIALNNLNQPAIETLLKHKDVEVVDQKGDPLLFLAIKLGHEAIAEKFLLRAPQYIEARNELELTPLLMATWGGRAEIVRILLQHQADFRAVTSDERNTILHLAAGSRHDETFLLVYDWLRKEKVLDLDRKNNDGRTPLHLAVRTGDVDIIKRLLTLGADRWVTDRFGKKPVDYRPSSRQLSQISQQIAHLFIET
jgi:ankyrin repeat protein